MTMRDHHFSFERMIHPVGVDTFLRDYWEQKPLVIERGVPDYYAGVLSMADIDSIVGFRQLEYSQLKIARAEQGQPDQVFYVDSDSTSNTNRLFHSYGQGDTVALNFAQCYWEPAARLCSVFENLFHFPAGANAYLTPRNSQGFPPHFDSHDVFVIQVEGAKRWRIYSSQKELPCGMEDNKPVRRELLGEPLREFRLTAGDLLYIPRGWVHEARTTDVSSLHVTVGVRSYKWTDLLGELLATASQESSELRKALPVGFMNSQEALELMVNRLPQLISTLADSGRIENSIGRLRQRLIERKRPLPDAHFRSLDEVDEIDLDTVVAKREGMMCQVSRRADFVEIAFPGNRMKGPVDIETAFRFIADSKQAFSVRALPDILSDKSKLVLARRSIREGLLRISSLKAAHPTA
jgi:ribosomal protein L16 Arg81 hydroxylase